MKKILIILVGALICFVNVAHSADEHIDVEIKNIGRTKVSFNYGANENMRLDIITIAAVQPDAKDENAYLQSIGILFGRQDMPDTVIAGIRVEWGGLAPYMLSASASSDLYSPNSARVSKKGDRVLLHISGGDGAVGYEAEIELAPYGAITRRVRHRTSGYVETTDYQHTPKRIRSVTEKLDSSSKKPG